MMRGSLQSAGNTSPRGAEPPRYKSDRRRSAHVVMRECSRQGTRASGDCDSSNLFKGVPVDWGPTFEHRGIGTTLTRTGPNSLRFQAPAHLAIVMLSPQPVRKLALNSDRSLCFLAPAGSIEIVPAATDLFASWSVPKTNLLTSIDPTVL